MIRICVVGPFNPSMRAYLSEAFGPEYVLKYVGSYEEYTELYDADFIIIRTLELREQYIRELSRCKLIQRWGAGFDSVDIKAAGECGIPVAVTVGVNATPVSEMTIALMLAVYRNIVPMNASIMNGSWEREEFSKHSYTINGKVVGIFGMGNIGRKVARLAQAFGAKVLYYDPYRLSAEQEKELNVLYCEPDRVWKESDLISLHSPLTEETRYMANAGTLSLMKKNAVLINTARPELVDIGALAAELKSGHLLGAGLDAIDESIIHDNPLKDVPNVVLTAHLGGNTVDNAFYMAQRCSEQIQAVFHGEKLKAPHLVNAEFLKES